MASTSALSHRSFRIVWIGSLFAYIAQWVQQVAFAWVAYEVTGSALMLGLILGIRALPMLLLAPFSGVAADRYDRRRLLAASQLANALVAVVTAAMLAADIIQTWHLFALVIIAGISGTFERNLRQAIVLDLVPREAGANAVALNNMGLAGARVFAPVISGLLIVWIGAAGNFLIQGLVYLGVAVSLVAVHSTQRPRPEKPLPAWASLREGLSFSAGNPSVRVLFVSGLIPFFILIPVWGTLLPVYARDIFNTGPQALGLLFSAVGLGGLIGGVIGAFIGRYDRLGLVSLGALAMFAFGLVGVGLSPTLLAALPFLVLAGVGEFLNIVANQTMLQMVAPERMRGRVTSLIAMFPAFISLGSVLVGVCAGLLGTRGTTVTLALAGGLGCAAFWMFSPRLRALRLSHHR